MDYKMEGVLNFRDLGGIKTLDGRVVKQGVFFRSGMLNNATKKDIEKLRSLDLKVILDYRDDDEVEFIKNSTYPDLGAKHINISASLNNDKLYKLKNTPTLLKAFKRFTIDDLKVTYEKLPFENPAYKKLVEILLKGEVPLLHHCTAGKDRAGLATALLLGILGVGYEEILADYLESLKVKESLLEMATNILPKIFHRLLKKRFEALFSVDKVLLDASIKVVKDKYGSFNRYLEKEYALTKVDINKIRSAYLTKIK